jgi:hypothetical protein
MDDRNVDQVVRSALAAGVVEAGPHPDPDTLFEYHAGELSAADADAVQGHLALCPACAQAVLDFEMFPHLDAASEEDDVPTAEEIEAGWADVQARLAAAAPVGVDRATGGAAEGASERGERAEADAQHAPPANVVPMTPRGGTAARPPAAPAHRVPAWLATAAALLAATTLGLGGYSYKLRTALAKAERPSHGALLQLDPVDASASAVRGTPSAPEPPPRQTLTRGKPASLLLGVTLDETKRSYRVELLPAEGTGVLWVDANIAPETDGVVSIVLPHTWWPVGPYRIRLTPHDGGPALEYEFSIVDE